jgi:hypothetical protein
MPVIKRKKRAPTSASDEVPWTLDEDGFVQETRYWTPVERYALLDEKVRGVNIYRTILKNPLQYSVVCSLRQGELYQWPAVVAIRFERRLRFDPSKAMRFGIRGDPDSNKVTEWCLEADFPDFRDAHVFISNPDYVLMGSDWSKKKGKS